MTLRLVSWNLHCLAEAWQLLADDRERYQLALVQELPSLPATRGVRVLPAEPGEWHTAGWEKRNFRTAIAVLDPKLEGVEEIPTAPLGMAGQDHLAISRPGTITAARVSHGDEVVTVMSVYAPWERPIPYTEDWIYADASAHRIISDLSALCDSQRLHRLIVAGDWNLLRGYGEYGSPYWQRRYETVFARMEALNLRFVGPVLPKGRVIDPMPEERPPGNDTVPTFRTRAGDPSSATRQLDFVFASADLAERVTVVARDEDEDWGPSDHCRIDITLEAAGTPPTSGPGEMVAGEIGVL